MKARLGWVVWAAACATGTAPQPGPGPGPGPGADSVALQLVSSDLTSPVYLTAPPGDTDRLFVVEQGGLIRVLVHDTLLPTPFLDVAGHVVSGGEQGLLSLAFHPDYARNGRFFVYFTDPQGDSRVVRYSVGSDPNVADSTSGDTVLAVAQPYPNHNGGLLLFGPDGKLYIGLGDGGSGGDPQGNGQNLGVLLGKILRLDVDGAAPYVVPGDNPFVSVAGARGEIWAYGLRNPWRFWFDHGTGDLYIGDVGQNAWEEVDVQPAGTSSGRNYGWNVMEGLHCYAAPSCTQSGLVLPVIEYGHAEGCSITGGVVYRGSRVPLLQGRYLYGDYCSGWVRSFRYAGGRAAEEMEWPSLAVGGGLSSFGEDPRGDVYLLTLGGAVYRLVPAP
jgi:glucose/arabinose dehydrogenase